MPKHHKKTRTGCAQCKRRRVKCDEKKPSCANCDRNSLPCSLEFLTPMKYVNQEKSVVVGCRSIVQTLYTDSYSSPPKLSRELRGTHYDDQTNELLHHYTTTLSVSIAGNRRPLLWRVLLLQMSLAHPFLFSGIMAISALHLATLQQHRGRELHNFAISQECVALPLFRAALNDLNGESVHAAFAFAGSIVYYMMALPEGQDATKQVDRCRIPSKVMKYPHWFDTIRGLMLFLTNYWDELAQGPFGPLLNADLVRDYSSDNPDDEHLAKLEDMFTPRLIFQSDSLASPIPIPASSLTANQSPKEARKVEACKEALDELRKALVLTLPPHIEIYSEAALRMWPGHISQDFVELIYERDPRALVILAHFCVLLKKNDHIWYLRGLGQGLLENIWEALDEEWRPWIKWPLEQFTEVA